MAELASSPADERISEEKAEGTDVPLPSTPGDERHSSPLERTNDEQREATECAGEKTERNGISSEQDRAFLSPGFRSAVAMAGWDAETLLMAALFQSPINARCSQDGSTSARDTSPAKDGLRKRDKRTPSSSGPRPRKARWETSNGYPLGRVPMQPLTLLSGSEHDNMTAPTEKGCDAVTRENCDQGTKMSKEDSTSSSKDASSSMPPCLDKLREELSCAVCLDICFEPSTISCGHSFCGTCLRSALKNCGPRCPKCRQTVRSEASRKYQINTVLWNTIQILFPMECAAKLQDQKHSCDEDVDVVITKERPSRGNLGTRPSRLQPWRGYESSNGSDPISVTGNLSSSFLSASELLLGRNRSRDRINTFRQFGPLRTTTRHTARLGDADAVFQEERNPLVRDLTSRGRRSGIESAPVTQEEIDEDLAIKLQEAELNARRRDGSSTAATSRDPTAVALATSLLDSGFRIHQQHRRRQRS